MATNHLRNQLNQEEFSCTRTVTAGGGQHGEGVINKFRVNIIASTVKAWRWSKNLRRSLWLKLFLSLILLAVAFYLVDLQIVADTLLNLNPWYLLPYVVLFYLDRALMAYKWNILLLVLNVRVPFLILFRTCSVVPLVAMALPATIGGDAFRVYSLARHKLSARAVLASIIMERIIGFAAALLLAAFSLGLAFYLMRDQWAQFAGLAWALLLLIGLALGSGLLVQGLRSKRIKNIATRLSRYRIVSRLYALCVQFWEFRNHRQAIAIVFGWTFLEQLVPIGWNFLLIKALHIDISLLELAAIVPLIILAVRIPISFEGIGVQEGLYIGLLALVGVPPAEALLLSTASRVMNMLCTLPWGIHYILRDNQKVLTNQQTTDIDSGRRDFSAG